MLSTTKIRPRFGEIWMCHLTGKDGSVQGGYRPVFILSNDKNNTYSTTLNIIPITSKMNKRRLPVHVELWSYESYGLRTPSTMMIEQTTTITVESLDRKIGAISDRGILAAICKAMTVQFPIFAMV
jgi:mRNA interferase MazF